MKIVLQPKLLQWARERAGLHVGELAKKLHTTPERIRHWERTGELRFSQAESRRA